MGVDARIAVKIKGKDNWISEKETRRISYMLGSTIGHDNFFTMRPEQGTFNEVQNAIEIVEPFDNPYDDEDEAHLVGKRFIFQDAEDEFFAEDDEQLLEVNLMGRYYGPSYERGDWKVYFFVIVLLRNLIPNSKVFYGGDSAGIKFVECDEKFMHEMNKHYVENGGRPYRHYDPFSIRTQSRPVCKYCDDAPMVDCGGGGAETYWCCDGCGLSMVQNDLGERLYNKNHEDFFDAHKRFRNGERSNAKNQKILGSDKS